jgi:stalled ribosome rescue protein Dom34
MSYYAVWVDHKHAFLYKFGINGVDETKMTSDSEHPGGSHSHDKFYHSIAQKMSDAKELMIMGPGVAKDEFKNHCEKHHHTNLAKVIVGVEPMVAHPTKALMLEKARDFFKHHQLWTKNY